MSNSLFVTKFRTHTLGELNKSNVGQEVTVAGWVAKRRDHGGLIFVDLRDRFGLTQIVFNPEKVRELHKEAEKIRLEYVIQVTGKVVPRPAGTENPKLPTGEIEIEASDLKILNASEQSPFEISEDSFVSDDVRLKYRFLDLRRKMMQRNLKFRYDVTRVARTYFDGQGFMEVETPCLTKSTPEGARDYLVPARLSPGDFYALPQSPQLFKQLLMVSGIDRYYQLARCFRDEDLRADRQPEHTQIDVEMSFIGEENIMNLIEGLLVSVFKNLMKIELKTPFRRMSYDEAMNRYGSDKPDLRFGLEMSDVTELFKDTGFKVFQDVIQAKGAIKALPVSGGAQFSRKDMDDMTEHVKGFGAKGLVWMKRSAAGEWESPVAKFFTPEVLEKIAKTLNVKNGDVVFMVASDWRTSCFSLGALRNYLANKLKLIAEGKYELCWVVDFPMFEYSDEEKRLMALHHPFTAPKDEDVPKLKTHPETAHAKAYDIVLNGTEIGGGSIRIHDRGIQSQVFECLGIGEAEAQEKFGFLLKALSFGAPPHGGIAIGLDRLCAVLLGAESIRDVIAFPKTQKGTCLMTEAPSKVAPKQLKELHLKPVA
ncbi:MAG: aspartate--tRNA ligase [Candidatus Omnitrophica bacterium]|nr:aspartate--tRNA ligase [Candidatus Omnitrophota bacterium]